MLKKTTIQRLLGMMIILFTLLFFSSFQQDETFKTVKIGTQEWMIYNLQVDHYRNGDIIPQVQDSSEWAKLTTGAWCYYENKVNNGWTYGKLYNWYAVTDLRGLAPKGFHIPTASEWTQLTNELGGKDVAGAKIKTTHGWGGYDGNGNNESGFTGHPCGFRKPLGDFHGLYAWSFFWTSTESDKLDAWSRMLGFPNSSLNAVALSKKYGLAVRCVADKR